MGFVGFEDSVTTKTETSSGISGLDTVLMNMSDYFIPLVTSVKPKNKRWKRLVQRFSERKLRDGKCFLTNVDEDLVSDVENANTIG